MRAGHPTFILEVESINFLNQPAAQFVHDMASDLMIVSKRRILLKTTEHIDANTLLSAASQYSSDEPKPILIRISSFEPRSIWARPSQAALRRAHNRTREAPWEDPNDVILNFVGIPISQFEDATNTFLEVACAFLNGKDRAFPARNVEGKQPCDVWFERRGNNSLGKAILFGWARELARVFFVTFRNYPWAVGDGATTVVVELRNAVFEQELINDFQYRWKANHRALSVSESAARNAILCPPPPPGAPPPAQRIAPALPTPAGTGASSSFSQPAQPAHEPSAKRRAGQQ